MPALVPSLMAPAPARSFALATALAVGPALACGPVEGGSAASSETESSGGSTGGQTSSTGGTSGTSGAGSATEGSTSGGATTSTSGAPGTSGGTTVAETTGGTSTGTAGTSSGDTGDTSGDDTTTGGGLDDVLTLEHVQVKGTHNSYHVEPLIPFDASHEYTHEPLDVQLAEQGVRAFELDIHKGVGGLEVYHIAVIDAVSTCDAFTECLDVIKGWSDQHPLHLPVVIWLEIKDSTGGLPIGAADLDGLDDDIRGVFPADRLFTPDDLQGDHPSVRAALEADGWPTLGELRGQVLFVILNTEDAKADAYTKGYTTTAGRAAFARAATAQFDLPWAAIAKLGLGDEAAIDAAHDHRMLIATNVCGAGQADAACAADLAVAKANGIHMLKDDFPAKVDGKSYFMDFPDGNPARCNPVTAPPECTSVALEDL